MGTRNHSVGKGNGTPRTLKGQVAQLRRMLDEAKHELTFAWSKQDPKEYERIQNLAIKGLEASLKMYEEDLLKLTK